MTSRSCAHGQRGDLLQFGALDHRAGRIVRVAEQEHLGARRQRRLDGRRLAPRTGPRREVRDRHDDAASERHVGLVGDVAGIGDQHLVALVEEGAQRRVDALADADRDQHLAARDRSVTP